ncbi:MAG: DUF5994 family protein [Mycobacterium sp.]
MRIARKNPDIARLATCDRAIGAGGVDGAWWPATQDLNIELPDLIAVVGAWIGPIRRVVYDRRAWLPAPARIIRGQTSITVDAYRLVASDTIYLQGTHSRDAVLFIVPPKSSGGTATRVLGEVAKSAHPMSVTLARQLLRVPLATPTDAELWGGPVPPGTAQSKV